MMSNNKETYRKAIDTYGKDKQLDVVIEEMSELTKEICKFKRGQDNHQQIVEEIADVEIMLQQLKMICDVKCSELEGVKYQKTERLSERLRNDEAKDYDRYIHINIYDDNLSIKGCRVGPDAITRAIDGLADVLISMK